MNETDPLIRLLQTADASAAAPVQSVDLAVRVQQKRKTQLARARRMKFGALSVAGVGLLAVALVRPWRPPAGSSLGAGGETPGENGLAIQPANEPGAIGSKESTKLTGEQLLAEARSLDAEARALERLIAAHQNQQRLQELTAEHDRLLVATSAPDPAAAALDRLAASAVCQADFLWETLGDRRAAETAYRNVVENFPDTHWAMLAQDGLANWR